MKPKSNLLVLFSLIFFALSIFRLSIVPVSAQTQPPACTSPVGSIWNPDTRQCKCPPGQKDVSNKCVLVNPAPGQLVSESDFGNLLKKLIDWALYFAGSIAVIFLIVGGYQYVTSRGNEEAMERAKRTVGASILGVVIIIMAYAIILIINNLLTTTPS